MKATTRKIALAHIDARLSGNFDDPPVNSREELLEQLNQGKTFSQLMEVIELRYTSITSILLANKLFHTSQNYKRGVYKGFKTLLEQ